MQDDEFHLFWVYKQDMFIDVRVSAFKTTNSYILEAHNIVINTD